MRSIKSFFLFLFFLQYAAAAPLFLQNRRFVITIQHVDKIAGDSNVGFKLQDIDLGGNRLFQTTPVFNLNSAPNHVMTFNLGEEMAFSPLTLTLNRSGENAQSYSSIILSQVSTTVMNSDFTLTAGFANVSATIQVNVTHTLLECSTRVPTESTCYSTFEDQNDPENPCYIQISSSTGFESQRCAKTCSDHNLTVLNDTLKKCQLDACSARIPNTAVMNVCGPQCYQQLNSSSNTLLGSCALTCPDTNLTRSNPVNGKCELIKECGSRTPNSEQRWPCGRNCFKQIISSTGAEDSTCMSDCPDGRLTRQNDNTGKCVMKTCATRAPNVDVTPVCGALCDLLPNFTCEGIGGSDADDEDIPIIVAPQTEQGVTGGDVWKNVKTTLAIALPVAAFVTVVVLVVCIVLVVLNAPKKEKKLETTNVEDGEVPAFPWQGKSPAPIASPAPLDADKDSSPTKPADSPAPAGTGAAASSKPTTAATTTQATTQPKAQATTQPKAQATTQPKAQATTQPKAQATTQPTPATTQRKSVRKSKRKSVKPLAQQEDK